MRPLRRGITLVETLVVLGIMGVLLAILIPAIQYSRETARKAACQNNLRQQALAVMTFESSHGAIPSFYNGTFLDQPRGVIDEFHFHSWRTAILAQLGQEPLYQRINLALPASDVSNQTHLNTSVGVFLCPSTSNPSVILPEVGGFNDGAMSTQFTGTAARSDYEAVAGVHSQTNDGEGYCLGHRFGAWGEPKCDPNSTHRTYDRTARLRDITDGMSSTILIAERAGRPDLYRRGIPVDPYPPDNPSQMDTQQAAWGISTNFEWLIFEDYQSINDTNATGIFSFHSGGAYAAFADGSVRFLSESINQDALNAMATRSAGDIVTLD